MNKEICDICGEQVKDVYMFHGECACLECIEKDDSFICAYCHKAHFVNEYNNLNRQYCCNKCYMKNATIWQKIKKAISILKGE